MPALPAYSFARSAVAMPNTHSSGSSIHRSNFVFVDECDIQRRKGYLTQKSPRNGKKHMMDEFRLSRHEKKNACRVMKDGEQLTKVFCKS